MGELLKDKIALVTGGGGDIGRATARIFAREGAAVIISDINEDAGWETARLISNDGGQSDFVKADVSTAEDVRDLIAGIVMDWGRLDCAFNNAGIEGAMRPMIDLTEDEFDRTVLINQKSVWLCMKYQIKQMLVQGGGAIVNTSSAAGLIGFPNFSDYVASKHGVVGLTRTAALEYAAKGIRVNAVCPGMIDTAMVDREAEVIAGVKDIGATLQPIGRLGRAEEVGEAVAWLCSDAASFVIGHPMAICGGGLAQ